MRASRRRVHLYTAVVNTCPRAVECQCGLTDRVQTTIAAIAFVPGKLFVALKKTARNGSNVGVASTTSRSPRQNTNVVPMMRAISAFKTVEIIMDLGRTRDASWVSSAVELHLVSWLEKLMQKREYIAKLTHMYGTVVPDEQTNGCNGANHACQACALPSAIVGECQYYIVSVSVRSCDPERDDDCEETQEVDGDCDNLHPR